jgi:DNA-binding NtrC family response regulator
MGLAAITTRDPSAEDNAFFTPLLRIRNRRILVVEDDIDLRTPIERVARSIDRDLQVDWASNVAGAFRLFERSGYDLVLADYVLESGPTGLVLQSWVAERHPRTRFAMMSAYLMRDDLRSAIGGSFPFLPKPFTVADCRSFIEAALP